MNKISDMQKNLNDISSMIDNLIIQRDGWEENWKCKLDQVLALEEKVQGLEAEVKRLKDKYEMRYCEGNNCGNPLEEKEEKETGLCQVCYERDMRRVADERRHPDEKGGEILCRI